MRRKEKEISSIEGIETVLQEGLVCHLGLTEGKMPYVVPINYAYENGCIYFHSAAVGKKMDILKQNNNICFAVDVLRKIEKNDISCNWGTKFESVIGFGKAVFVEDFDEKIKALDAIMKHYDIDNLDQKKIYQYNSEILKRVAVVRIEIKSMTGKRG